MKSGGPWNLRGLRPQAREAAREAARRSGMSVGEWLNTVIPADEDDEPQYADFDREWEDRWREEDLDRDERGRRRDPRRYAREREPGRLRQRPLYDEREGDWQRSRDRNEDDQQVRRRATRPGVHPWPPGGPYYEGLRHEGPRRERIEDAPRAAPRDDERGVRPHGEPSIPEPLADNNSDARVDEAVAEILARQRALDAAADQREQQPREREESQHSFGERQPAPSSALPQESRPVADDRAHPPTSAGAFYLTGLERQLREITLRIEALRPSGDLEGAIGGLRADLAEIGRSLNEALPRHAIESLEIEIKALTERIDHSRAAGGDAVALGGVERGLGEVREALQALKPAESLVGFDEAVQGLAKKVDAIAARDDPAARQQLEGAIGALRGIAANIASNDTLTKVAEEVRTLAGKIDGLSSSAPAGPSLSTIDNRIGALADALKASTEAGYAVPRELERLLSGLIEKLEWVQLTHTDHAALGHLEDRIATLVKRLDASDSRLHMLEGVERGLADLLVHIDRLRDDRGADRSAAGKSAALGAIEHEVVRTQDSLEAVQDTVGHVVDRLAMIESDINVEKAKAALMEPLPAEDKAAPPVAEPESISAYGAGEIEPASETADAPAEVAERTLPSAVPEPAAHRQVTTRTPIDPSLPPDHPLEPGLVGRPRNVPPAAVRIAASEEAAVESKPPVIPDPRGGKADFIAAARRAAQAAAQASPQNMKGAAGTSAEPKTLADRVRALAVAAAVVVIVVGGYRIVTRLFEDGAVTAPPPVMHVEPPPMRTMPQPAPAEPPRGDPGPPPQLQPPPAQTDKAPSPLTEGPQAAPAASQPSSPVPLPDGDTVQRPNSAALPGWDPETPSLADITGSLPQGLAQHNPMTAASPAPAGVQPLPSTIGSSALRAAALAGDPWAAYEVAVRYAEGRAVPLNNAEAAHWFERAAKKGLAPAEFRLGSLYEKGLGVRKSLATARDFYRAAAEKGHGKAMHNLAVLYAEGVDGKPDYRTAAQWFRKAADYGITDSQFNLAVLYARGVGVEQNFAESYKWFFLAAKAGDQDAVQKRDEVASHLDEEALSVARIEVEKWTPLPQPTDAVTVKGAWDLPASPTSLARPKPGPTAKTSAAAGSAPGGSAASGARTE